VHYMSHQAGEEEADMRVMYGAICFFEYKALEICSKDFYFFPAIKNTYGISGDWKVMRCGHVCKRSAARVSVCCDCEEGGIELGSPCVVCCMRRAERRKGESYAN